MLSVARLEWRPRGDAAALSAVWTTPPQRGAAAILSVALPRPRLVAAMLARRGSAVSGDGGRSGPGRAGGLEPSRFQGGLICVHEPSVSARYLRWL